jgi:hypothetical protein
VTFQTTTKSLQDVCECSQRCPEHGPVLGQDSDLFDAHSREFLSIAFGLGGVDSRTECLPTSKACALSVFPVSENMTELRISKFVRTKKEMTLLYFTPSNRYRVCVVPRWWRWRRFSVCVCHPRILLTQLRWCVFEPPALYYPVHVFVSDVCQ